MIFQHTHQLLLTRQKTATRRRQKPGQVLKDGVLYSESGRRLHWVGQNEPVQPGRCQKSIGRIRITAIYKQALGDMTEGDANKEGFRRQGQQRAWTQFVSVWLDMYKEIDVKTIVLVYEFEWIE